MAVGIGLVVVAVLLVAGAVLARARRAPAPTAVGLAVAGVLVAVAGALFLFVAADETLDATDLPVLSWLVEHRTAGFTTTAEVASLAGGTFPTGGLAVLAAVLLLRRGLRVRAGVWVGAVVVGSLTIRGFKTVIERPRPPVGTRLAVETSTSLPSGHSLMAALGIGLTVAAALHLLPADPAGGGGRKALRGLIVLVGVLLAGLIGVSRAYLGVHWTTDVLAGWSLGGALLALAVVVAGVLERRSTEIHPSEGVRNSPVG
ncbi:phosphatase PAP2 family protein [Actinomycetospora atypica]|uniref:Phosphatase PAP2 family protein n=1 Tax=Actinomycetospora atypica TaxID=1290095 RepID=A0ABV9YCZ3_9PSEU